MHDVAVNCVRSKDAQKQLARTSLSSHDGNAKENVTLKMTSKYFKLLRDSFNSFNLSNIAEKSGS